MFVLTGVGDGGTATNVTFDGATNVAFFDSPWHMAVMAHG